MITALLVAAGMSLFLIKSRLNYLRLPELPVASGERDLDVTVIIPARNEEASIATAVESFPGLRVIVVDDAGQDATAREARRAGADVVAAPALAAGECGKPNACRAGAALASTRWLLFVDADTAYTPEFAPSLLAYAERESAGIVTPFLNQTLVTAAEKCILPYAFALYFCGVSASNVNSPDSRESLANGQCILFRRDLYESIGGHSAVANSVIEDVALATLAKRRGVRLCVVRAERLGRVRMYDSFTAIRRGFEKNSFRFLNANPFTGLQVVAASVLMTSYLPVLIWLIAQSRWRVALPFAALPSILLWPWYGSFERALCAPAAIYVFQLIALSGMVRTLTGTGAIWKGRRV